MASAVLASRNESSWGQSGGGFMGKLPPYSNHLTPNPKNPNPKPNSVPKKKKLQEVAGQINSRRAADDLPDDAYSFNQRSNDSDGFNQGEYINFNIGSYKRDDLIELKKRLVDELDQIQRLNDQIDSGKFQPRLHGGGGGGHKLPGKNKNKRPIPPLVSGKDPKRLCQSTSDDGVEIGNLMKMCRQVLTKLMKHKNSWLFNKPVDVVRWGLHDYHQIIKRPMDLGTVKTNFAKNLYSSPEDFAADVRLTFDNAMLYNPKVDEVHKFAEELLDQFQELYRPIEAKFESDQKQQASSWSPIPPAKKSKPDSMPTVKKQNKARVSASSTHPSPSNPPLLPTAKKHEKIEVSASSANPSSSSNPPPLLQSPVVPTPPPMQAPPVKPAGGRGGKLPKPKAKDPDKRPMSMDEKHRLGIGLQDLPQEKMPGLIQIIRKQNAHMAPEGDEIELDIEAIDTETLWELDRFVTNWKKAASKNKRQALMVNNNSSAAATASGEEDNVPSVSEKTDNVKKLRKGGEGGEEEVDIGDDDAPMSNFPPVEIEKDDGGHEKGHDKKKGHATSSSSSSGSSSSDSSSSSGSDSGSSSGSDSDADEAQSRGLESKEFSKT